jgi:hypothetical protein
MPPDVTPLHLFDHPDIEAFRTWSGFLVVHMLAPWAAPLPPPNDLYFGDTERGQLLDLIDRGIVREPYSE